MKTTACGVQRNLCMFFSPHWRHDLKPFLTSAPLTGNIPTCRHLTVSYPLYHPDHGCHLWTKLYYKWGPEWSRTASPFPRRRREKGGRRVLTVKSFGTGLGFVHCRLWRWSIMAAGTESRTELGSQRSDLRSADDATNSSFWLDARWFYLTGILRECLVLFHFISEVSEFGFCYSFIYDVTSCLPSCADLKPASRLCHSILLHVHTLIRHMKTFIMNERDYRLHQSHAGTKPDTLQEAQHSSWSCDTPLMIATQMNLCQELTGSYSYEVIRETLFKWLLTL